MSCRLCELQADLFRAHEEVRAENDARVSAMRRERASSKRAWARRFKALQVGSRSTLVIRRPIPFEPLTLERLGFTAGGIQ